MMQSQTPWYVTNYEFDPIENRPDLLALAEDQASFIVSSLGLRPGDRVLDLCGGAGRIAIPLGRRALAVTVVDLSQSLLDTGKKKAQAADQAIEWVKADMRNLPQAAYEAVINVFTSFGYFDSEADNDAVLRSVRDALKPGGLFLIDLTNRDMRALYQKPRTWKRVGGVTILEEHHFDLATSRWNVTREFIPDGDNDGSRRVLQYSLRVYSPHEIRQKLESAGFVIVSQSSRISGLPLTPRSWRHVTIAQAR